MEYIQVNTHIHLEAIHLAMAPVIFDAIDHDRKYLSEWLPFVDVTRSVTDTELYIKSLNYSREHKRDQVYTIWYKMEFAGLIGFKDTDWVNNKTEIGYWLIEKMQGKGVATLSTGALVRYAFNKLGMNRVQIKVAKENNRSAAIPIRLGFRHEGTERQGEFLRGGYHDLEVFSRLKSDRLSIDC